MYYLLKTRKNHSGRQHIRYAMSAFRELLSSIKLLPSGITYNKFASDSDSYWNKYSHTLNLKLQIINFANHLQPMVFQYV